MSSGFRTIVARPAQYTDCRLFSPTVPSASAKVSTVPIGTVIPTPRTTDANAAGRPPDSASEPAVELVVPATIGTGGSSGVGSWGVGSSGATLDGRPHQLADAGRPHALLVLAVLEHGAEGRLDGVLVQLRPAQ